MMPTQTFDPAAQPSPDQPDSTATLDQTFPVGEGCRFSLENPRGQVRITGWDRPEVHFRATKLHGNSSLARFNATCIEVQHDEHAVWVRTVLDSSAPFRDRGAWNDLVADAVQSLGELLRNTALPAEVIYDVQVPRQADLDLKGITAATLVDGVRGAIRAHNVSGGIRLARVQGDISIHTVSGSIEARDLSGYLDAKSVSGSIRVGGKLDALRADSVSGSMELAGSLAADGSYDFHTVSGSVTVRVPADTSATISGHGVSMAVTSDLPCQVLRDARGPGSRRWQGRLNGGSATVSFRTVSGHLYVAELLGDVEAGDAMADHESSAGTDQPADAAGPAATAGGSAEHGDATPTAETPGATSTTVTDAVPDSRESEQLRVLQAIERGELPVDEGLRQLEALRFKE